MSNYPINPALEAAIVAHAEEDTPRLAYADWLDENGDPDRAAFIRVQCRLAEVSPAHPDWVGLGERQNELLARLAHRPLTRVAEGVPGFDFGYAVIDRHKEPYRRGFPYSISCQTAEATRVTAELDRLVRTTTIRSLHLSGIPFEQLAELLAAPVIGELTGLALSLSAPVDRGAEVVRFCRALGQNPRLRRLRRLEFWSNIPAAAPVLAAAETFDSVVRLQLGWYNVGSETVAELLEGPWVRRVRDLSTNEGATEAVAAGVARLPNLHTLDTGLTPGAVPVLAAGPTTALERLIYHSALETEHAEALSRGQFPALVAFEATRGGASEEAFAALLQAEWFGHLRVLRLNECRLGDRAVEQLAAHPVAGVLRALHLGENDLGPDGLVALGRGALSELTTLSAWLLAKQAGTPARLAPVLAALQLPNLRHLDLNGWRLGDDGTRALAGNACFAGLTRLSLERCEIGDAGAAALFASPHLQNLVELSLTGNLIRREADALANPGVMPRLGLLRLGATTVPRETAERIRRRPGLEFVR
jgi:uncharacterized protein (TIGR02996 family)